MICVYLCIHIHLKYIPIYTSDVYIIRVHHTYVHLCLEWYCLSTNCSYGVAEVSRIDKIIGLFCKRDL